MVTHNEISPSSLASLSRRLLAFILDTIILIIPCAIAGHIIPFLGGVVMWFFYAPILESSEIRATLGKHLVGIQVVDFMGQRVSLRTAVIRNIIKFFSSVLLFIGFLFALFNQRKQTLHDLIADTLVVYGRSEKPISDAWVTNIKKIFQSSHINSNASETISQLERLQALRTSGALTEEEFQNQKREILSKT